MFIMNKIFLCTHIIQGKDVDASYARIDRDKRKAKQAAEEVETAKKTKAALLGEQFLLELLQIDIKQREEEEAFVNFVLMNFVISFFLFLFFYFFFLILLLLLF